MRSEEEGGGAGELNHKLRFGGEAAAVAPPPPPLAGGRLRLSSVTAACR